MKILQDFKAFALKGNVIDMAVGIIIGAAFSTLVKSLVDDVIMPPIGFLLGGVDFSDLFITIKEGATAGPYISVAAAKAAGAVTLNAGLFINSIISFLIVAIAVFILVKGISKAQHAFDKPVEEETPTDKDCPYCFTKIDIRATRCPNCTAEM